MFSRRARRRAEREEHYTRERERAHATYMAERAEAIRLMMETSTQALNMSTSLARTGIKFGKGFVLFNGQNTEECLEFLSAMDMPYWYNPDTGEFGTDMGDYRDPETDLPVGEPAVQRWDYLVWDDDFDRVVVARPVPHPLKEEA